jgi:hypothetical protein
MHELFTDLPDFRLQPRERGRSGRSNLGEPRRAPAKPMARSRVSEAPGMPPVMVRGSLASHPLPVRRTTHKVRRRFDVALNVPGAEMRLPALPQVRIGWRLVSALMVVVLAALLYQLWNSPGYRVEAVKVNGLQRLTAADVNSVLDIEGESIFTLSPSDLQQALSQSFPEFSNVRVEIALRNKVLVEVEERQPILVWQQDGRTMLVDANGYAFPPREGAPNGPDLTVAASSAPVIADVIPETGADLTNRSGNGAEAENSDKDGVYSLKTPFMPVEMVSAILSMKSQAPAGVTLVYAAQHGLGWKDAQGWEVYFGDVRDMGVKLNIYKALVSRLQSDGIQPALVSVEYVKAPYYHVEQ